MSARPRRPGVDRVPLGRDVTDRTHGRHAVLDEFPRRGGACGRRGSLRRRHMTRPDAVFSRDGAGRARWAGAGRGATSCTRSSRVGKAGRTRRPPARSSSRADGLAAWFDGDGREPSTSARAAGQRRPAPGGRRVARSRSTQPHDPRCRTSLAPELVAEDPRRCARQDSNLRPLPPQGSALSPELRARGGQV